MNFKSIFKSKTFWFNAASAVATFGMAAAGVPVDPAIQGAVIAGGNTLLRFFTKQPVNILGGDK